MANIQFDHWKRGINLGSVKVVESRDRALRILSNGESLWIPKSQILSGSSLNVGDEGELTISVWLALKRGILQPPDVDDSEWAEDYGIFHE